MRGLFPGGRVFPFLWKVKKIEKISIMSYSRVRLRACVTLNMDLQLILSENK